MTRDLPQWLPFGANTTFLPLGLIQPALGLKRRAKVDMGSAVLGVEFNGLVVRLNGLVQPALSSQGDAEVVVGRGILGVEVTTACSAAATVCGSTSFAWSITCSALPWS